MQYIEVIKNGKTVHKIPFADQTYLIGSLPYASVFLDSKDVLPEQARLIKQGKHIEIYNLGTGGEIFVNKKPVKSTVLSFKDEITIGEFTLRFIEAEETEEKKESLVDTAQLKAKLHRALIDRMELQKVSVDKLGDKQLWCKCDMMLDDIIKEEEIPEKVNLAELKKDVLNEALALGPLEDLLHDDTVTEIMVNGKDKIYIERGGKIELTNLSFTSDENVRNIISRIVNPLGRRIDESSPMVDARLKDGSRVNAIIPPLVLQGPTLDIRKFSRKMLTDNDLIGFGSVTRETMDFLKVCVKMRKSILVSGGTGTGKTSFLNVIASYIPHAERVLTIEDSAELRLPHENLVSLEARPPNIEGKGEVAIRDLVKNSLRMRPDRIIVGECRGGEAIDMLQAMNTGHEGSMTTIHANSTSDAMLRLETMVLMAGLDLPARAIKKQIGAALHIIVQQQRFSDGSRRVVGISVVEGYQEENIIIKDIFAFKQTGIDKGGKIQGHIEATGYMPGFIENLEVTGLELNKEIFKKGHKLK